MKKILLLLLIMILFTGCQERTIRYTAKEMESNIDATNWNVAFVALDGNLTEGFMVNPTEYPNLNYDISLGSGNMIVQVKQDKEVIELPHKKGTLSLEKFREGSLYISILGEKAEDGKLRFEWSAAR